MSAPTLAAALGSVLAERMSAGRTGSKVELGVAMAAADVARGKAKGGGVAARRTRTRKLLGGELFPHRILGAVAGWAGMTGPELLRVVADAQEAGS